MDYVPGIQAELDCIRGERTNKSGEMRCCGV